jgi:uncharacterized protein YqjF (DUF2071 family)
MRLPVLQGLIRRRILVNFRVDPEVMARELPPPFQPKLHNGSAIAGICLIRLEQIRPRGIPACFGFTSENAAHRVAARWLNSEGAVEDGVFITRRDTGSFLAQIAGGRIFPGEHHRADFDVEDDGARVRITVDARDGSMHLELRAQAARGLPPTSSFASLIEASEFFERGRIGYSVTRDCCRFDGIALDTDAWAVSPLEVEHVKSSYFDDPARFPKGSVVFDHALVMRDVEHAWTAVPDVRTERVEVGAMTAAPA